MRQETIRRKLLEKEKILICPEAYDCPSAKAVEMVGFQAMTLSSVEPPQSMPGVPETDRADVGKQGVLSIEEAVARNCRTNVT